MDAAQRQAQFGCYAEFYRGGSIAYLGFLNAGSPDELIEPARELVRIVTHPTWTADTLRLLGDPNWRSHLGVVACVFLNRVSKATIIEGLWQTARAGSWVSPQIVCTLAIVDPSFWANFRLTLSGGIQRQMSGSALLNHVEAGPGHDQSRLGKIANAASGAISAGLIREEAIGDLENLRQLAQHDFDSANTIVLDWLEGMNAVRTAVA